MKRSDLKNQIWTIPNMLTFVRILAVPFVIWCTIDKSIYVKLGEFSYPLIGLIIMAVAAATDLFDGFIARRFNQGSDLGIMLDPLADKLLHSLTVLALVIAGNVHWAFVAVLLLKEATMVIGGVFFAKNSKLIKANMMGKVASATLSAAIILSYFHKYWVNLWETAKVPYIDWMLLGVGLVLTYIAFFNYMGQIIKIFKQISAEKKAGINPEAPETDAQEK